MKEVWSKLVINQNELYKKLDFYQHKLLKIDRRNRSVYLHRIYDKWCFDLDSLSLQENNYVNKMLNKLRIHDSNLVGKVIECVLLGRSSIRILSDSDRSDLAENNRIFK